MRPTLKTVRPVALAGDIGATNSRLALFRGGPLEPIAQETYPSRLYPGLLPIVEKFMEKSWAGRKADVACFGIPGPVRADTGVTTNLPWEVRASDLAHALGIGQVVLLNDLEAIAHGVLELDEADSRPMTPAAPPAARGNLAVIAPGTGLGEAAMIWDGERHHPFASEGGHCLFSPSGRLEIELLQYLLGRFPRVSWERLLSGPGLANLYAFLRDTGLYPEPDWLRDRMRSGDPPRRITEYAQNESSELCERTVSLFLDLLAEESANLVLKTLATGGLYVAGGIVPRLLARIDGRRFEWIFTNQGRLSPVLENVPVRVVVNESVGVLGAARHALGQDLEHGPRELPGSSSPNSHRSASTRTRASSSR